MTKIKTLVESLNLGYEKAFESLDEKVENLGRIEIKEVKDSIFPIGSNLDGNPSSYIERIVIYKEENKIEGNPWEPTLDTDLIEFSKLAELNDWADMLLRNTYDKGKKTIRELIAMPYAWFKNEELLNKAGNNSLRNWDYLQKDLNKYGFKLYKKGNNIKN